MIRRVIGVHDGQPAFEKPLDEIMAEIKKKLLSCKHGEAFEFKRKYKPKTQKQCAVVFGLMIQQTIVQANDLAIGIDDLLVYLIDGNIPKGVGLTSDFLHELMYVICPTTDKDGRRVTLSKMDTVQASSLSERYRTLMAGIGIVIPDPDPNWNK